MSDFADSYVGQLRLLVCSRILLMPGARIVIEDTDERVLLQLRSDFDIWGLPGGMPEPGESVKQAIEREVFEETGLRVLIEIMCSTSKARHRALRRKNEDVARSSTPLGSRGDVARERSSRLRVS